MNTPTIFIAAAAAVTLTTAPLAVLTSGSASAGPAQWKIIINGQELANAGGRVSCGGDPSNYSWFGIEVDRSPNNSYVELTPSDTPTTVTMVSIASDTGVNYGFLSPDNRGPTGRGDAQLNKSGNTYKITGHIGKGDPSSSEFDMNSPLVPFEFDATCP